MEHPEYPIRHLYSNLLDAWNRRSASDMASFYAENGSQVGFDGSIANGRSAIEAQLNPIFADHPSASYVWIVREVRLMSDKVALLRAVVGMIPPGKSDIIPERNAVQTMVASRNDEGDWRVEMFQNTPAAFDGRPSEREKLSQELRGLASNGE